jgi:biopolymer transport protein ExbB
MLEHVLYYWGTAGPLLPVLFAVSFGIWFYFFRMRGALVRITRLPRQFEDELSDNLAAHSLEENLARYGRGADVLSASVAHALAAARRKLAPGTAFDERGGEHLARIGRDTVVLSALTTAAPLLGLLGTVVGMVATFRAVAGTPGNTAVEVSSGISQALLTTQFGLVVAIPGLFGLSRINRLLKHAEVRLGQCRSRLLLALASTERGR